MEHTSAAEGIMTNTRQTFLSGDEDMTWLRDVHCPTLPAEYHSAILYGNEDSPERIEAYLSPDPLVTDVPFIIIPTTGG
jgi:hypothetical protein